MKKKKTTLTVNPRPPCVRHARRADDHRGVGEGDCPCSKDRIGDLPPRPHERVAKPLDAAVARPVELVSDRAVAPALPSGRPPVVKGAALVEGDPEHDPVVDRVGNGPEDGLGDSHDVVLLEQRRPHVGAAGAELGEPARLEARRVGWARIVQGLGDGDGAGGGDVEERGVLGGWKNGI